MLQVSRANNLKIPKQIEITEKTPNTIEDITAMKKAYASANNEKFNEIEEIKKLEKDDKDLEVISKIPHNSNDLIVITIVKKLTSYVITVTEKSPKRFRAVFVNRMQNYCLDTLENLLQANYTRIDSIENKKKREEFQKQAIIILKLLGYIAMLAEISNCILKKHYKQISKQIAESINLIVAWKKSDDERWKSKH